MEVKLAYFQLSLERMRNLLEIDFLNRWEQQKLIDNSMKLSRIKTSASDSYIFYRERSSIQYHNRQSRNFRFERKFAMVNQLRNRSIIMNNTYAIARFHQYNFSNFYIMWFPLIIKIVLRIVLIEFFLLRVQNDSISVLDKELRGYLCFKVKWSFLSSKNFVVLKI